METSTTTTKTLCLHCGSHKTTETGKFCCIGCKTAYSILNGAGLLEYYQIKKRLDPSTNPINSEGKDDFSYLDDPELRKKLVQNSNTIEFYVDGIHCAACIWLLERLDQIEDGVSNSSVDFGKSTLKITLRNSEVSISSIARKISELGYTAKPLINHLERDELLKKENRKWLVRLGVAAACTGNIMLMSIPLYSGVEGSYEKMFKIASFFFFLPVIFYSAIPFYKSTLQSMVSKKISIDLPIALAIITASLVSFYNLLTNKNDLYFDSISSLVFLLLASRFLLKRVQQNILQKSYFLSFLAPQKARRAGVIVPIEALSIGDIIEVYEGETIPVDGKLLNDNALIDSSILTGESMPNLYNQGSPLFSGTKNMGSSIKIQTEEIGSNTRMGKILSKLESQEPKKIKFVSFADQVAQYYLFVVLMVAILCVFISPSISIGMSKALSLIIVTCPCALSLAIPLSASLALERAAQNGVLIKKADVLEKALKIKNIFFDKTGTLTSGKFEVLEINQKASIPNILEILYTIEKKSSHPIAKSIVTYIDLHFPAHSKTISMQSFKETIGVGIEAVIENKRYAVKSGNNIGEVVVYKDDVLVLSLTLADKARSNSKNVLNFLRKNSFSAFLLSGDKKINALKMGLALNFKEEEIFYEMSPEKKAELIAKHPNSMMVGDGINDSVAFKEADIGIAVSGSMEAGLRFADILLKKGGVEPVASFITYCKKIKSLMNRNLLFTILYNLIGGALALTGVLSPLHAAILMPLSALTVLASTLLGSRYPNQKEAL